MTTLITGGAGFLGLYLVREQLLRGNPVTILAHAGSAPAHDRCVEFLRQTGDLDRLPQRLDALLSVLESDVCSPQLGLTLSEYNRLAASVSAIWHAAGATILDGRDEHVWRTNVLGTGNVLELASQTGNHIPFHYISTAAVAGATQGVITESDINDDTEFRNTYEKSKFTAESLVRDWAVNRGCPTLLFRPSLLIPSHRLAAAGMPQHTLGTVCATLDSLVSHSEQTKSRIPIRAHGDPRARLNLLQVGWAAAAMVEIAHRFSEGVETVHIVNPADVHARIIAAALEDLFPVRVRMVPASPNDASPLEKTFYREMRGFLRYMQHNQRFDGARMQTALRDFPAPRQIDRGYLTYHLSSHLTNGSADVTSQGEWRDRTSSS